LTDAEIPRGMAHITGGGLPGNIARIIPDGLSARIDPARWTVPEVMQRVIVEGGIDQTEAFRAFNMGIGFVLVVLPDAVARVKDSASDALVIGEIVRSGSSRKVELVGTS
jgi:phosphoribosylformylglycinamidine cyclo-ligase